VEGILSRRRRASQDPEPFVELAPSLSRFFSISLKGLFWPGPHHFRFRFRKSKSAQCPLAVLAIHTPSAPGFSQDSVAVGSGRAKIGQIGDFKPSELIHQTFIAFMRCTFHALRFMKSVNTRVHKRKQTFQ